MASAATHADEQNFWPGYVDTLVNMVMFLILLIVILALAVMFFAAKARFEATTTQSTVPTENPSYQLKDNPYAGPVEELPVNPSVEDMRKLINKLKERLYQNELRFQISGLSPVAKPSETNQGNTDRMGTSEKMEEAPGLNPLARPQENKPGKNEKIEEASAPSIGSTISGVQDFALRPTVMIIRFRAGALDMTPQEAQRMSEVFKQHFGYEAGAGKGFLLTADAAQGLSESNRMAFYRVVAVRNHLMAVTGVPAGKIGQRIQAIPSNATTGMEALEVRITQVD